MQDILEWYPAENIFPNGQHKGMESVLDEHCIDTADMRIVLGNDHDFKMGILLLNSSCLNKGNVP